jgi:hypothetical protein
MPRWGIDQDALCARATGDSGDGDTRAFSPGILRQVSPPPVSPPDRHRWDTESAALIAFFWAARERLPVRPFQLTRWQFIRDPAQWYAALEANIAAGPRGVRARMGALQEDLRLLREYTEQIAKYNLPPQNFAKETSSNYDWFVERKGGRDTVYELEALNPEDMLRDLETVIQSVLDSDLFNREVKAEREESVYLEAARKRAGAALKGLGA